jgi:hypothetical protein
MSIKHDFEDIDFMSICIGFLWGALACCLIAMCVSCTKTEYITVEKVRTDTTYITKWQRDSIYLKDSTHVSEKGDTVRIDHWHTEWRDRWNRDTVYQATHDTIPQPYPVIKEVEKKLSRRQQMVMSVGSMAIMAALIWFLWWAVKILRRYGILKI